MITKYKKSFQKIAMGLLSFMPKEHELKALQQTIQRYEEIPDWHLHLWEEDEDFVGLIGIEVAENYFTVHHASVTPSYRSEGIGHAMIEEVQHLMKPREIRATEDTEAFLATRRSTLISYSTFIRFPLNRSRKIALCEPL